MLFPVALIASLALWQQTPPPAQLRPAPAAVAAAAPAPVRETADAQQAEPTQVCRMEPVTGSRFGRRVCRSVDEAAEDRVNSREMLRRLQGSRTPPVG